MLKKIVFFALILLSGGYYFLTQYNYLSKQKNNISIATLRQLNKSENPEFLPIKIEAISVGNAIVPRYFVASSPKKDEYIFSFTTFKVVYRGGATIIIDPAHNEASHKKFNFSTDFYPNNYQLIQQELLNTSLILFTHTHWDHIEGFSKSPNFEKIKSKARLSSEQAKSKFTGSNLSRVEILDYKKLKRVAPGIIAIKTPGHTSDSQSFFIKTQTGEYMVYGDLAYNQENLSDNKGRSLGFSLLSGDTMSDRKDASKSISLLIDLKSHGVNLLSSHDKEDLISKIKGDSIDQGWAEIR